MVESPSWFRKWHHMHTQSRQATIRGLSIRPWNLRVDCRSCFSLQRIDWVVYCETRCSFPPRLSCFDYTFLRSRQSIQLKISYCQTLACQESCSRRMMQASQLSPVQHLGATMLQPTSSCFYRSVESLEVRVWTKNSCLKLEADFPWKDPPIVS